MTLSEELTWRGFVNQTTYPDITTLDHEPISFYWGVDPSADSMTVGNLAAAMMVKCFMKHGHHAVLLVGGATGMIGDPDGKAQERELLSPEQLNANKAAIVAQYQQLFGGQEFQLVDNYDWFKELGYLDFLRSVGKHVPMRQMLNREFIQTRLGEQGSGISYAEFSYVLIQAYDFLTLYKEHDVTLQVCGSDQWGNSIAGVDLIRRETGGTANVYSVPLLVNETTGQKFGKSEGGAVWLDANKTSPFQFYQFWLNTPDESVEKYLKLFTDLDKTAVDDLLRNFEADRTMRVAQKQLALHVTALVHGEETATTVQQASTALFSEDKPDQRAIDILKKELPVVQLRELSLPAVVATIVETGLASSNTEANRFIQEGAISINGLKVTDDSSLQRILADERSDLIIKRGKNNFAIATK